MAIIDKTQLKTWFRNFARPTQEQFWAWMDSFWHKDEKIPQNRIEGWDEFLQNLPDGSLLQNYLLKDGTNLSEAERLVLMERFKALTYDFEYEDEDGLIVLVKGTGIKRLGEDHPEAKHLLNADGTRINPSDFKPSNSLVGSASTYAELANITHDDGSPLVDGNWVRLTSDDGTHESGYYKIVNGIAEFKMDEVSWDEITALLPSKLDTNFTNAAYEQINEHNQIIVIDETTKKAALQSKDDFLQDIQNKLNMLVPAPEYVAPVAVLKPVGSDVIEAGANVNEDLNLSYTQNDAGAATAFRIYKNGVLLVAADSYAQSSQIGIETWQYTGEIDHDAGAIKNNLFNEPDPRGAIAAGTIVSNTYTITGRLKTFFGAADKTVEANYRTLPQDAFDNQNNLILNTGTIHTNFYVAVPDNKALTSVIDMDALNAEIVSQYIDKGAITVNDAGGNAHNYKLYQMTIGTPYGTNHRHKLIIS